MTHPAPVQATPPHRPLIDDGDFTLFVGSAIDVLCTLPDESVHCVVTSPPYWGLRDYGTGEWSGGDPDCDHKQETRHQVQGATSQRQGRTNTEEQRNENFRDTCGKCGATRTDQQLGLEPTPEAYVDRMVQVFREVRRVLRKDGCCFLNLGDSYVGGKGQSGQGSAEYQAARADESLNKSHHQTAGPGLTRPLDDLRALRGSGLKPKDLVGIPWRVAFALQADGWYLRSEIIWAKRNCMPESVTDRPTKSHEQVFLLTRSPRYYFDQEAIREPHTPDGRTKTIHAHAVDNSHENYANMGTDQERWPNSGRNARSVWNIATQPYAEAHFATFPEELPRRCIAAGTSEHGCCPECGTQWERESKSSPDPSRPQAKRALELAEQHGLTKEHIEALQACGISDVGKALVTTNGTGRNGPAVQALAEEARAALGGYSREFLIRGKTETVGWRPGCECGDALPVPYRVPHLEPCVVLDPFMGSGTVALVARKLGRRSIGIELSPEYAELCARRLQQLSLLA